MYKRHKVEKGGGKCTGLWQVAVEPDLSVGQHPMPTLLSLWTLQHHLQSFPPKTGKLRRIEHSNQCPLLLASPARAHVTAW